MPQPTSANNKLLPNFIFLIFSLLLLWTYPLSAQPQLEWSRFIEGGAWCEAVRLRATLDSGFAIAGTRREALDEPPDLWLIILDNQGRTIGEFTYGSDSSEFASDFVQTDDGGFALVGSTSSRQNNDEDFLVVRADERGELAWTWTSERPGRDYAGAAMAGQAGGIIAGGVSLRPNGESGSFLTMAFINDAGELSDARQYDEETSLLTCSAIIPGPDSGFLLAGDALIDDRSRRDIFLSQIDNDYQQTKQTVYGSVGDETLTGILRTWQGGYLLMGFVKPRNEENTIQPYLVQLNSLLETVWVRQLEYSLADAGGCMMGCSDGGFLIVGSTPREGSDFLDIAVIRLNEDGDSLWAATYPFDYPTRVGDVINTPDGGFLITAITPFIEGESEAGLRLLKLTFPNQIHSTKLRNSIEDKNRVEVFPNPCNHQATIKLDLDGPLSTYIELIDAGGRRVAQWRLQSAAKGITSFTWNPARLQTGTYYLRITSPSQPMLVKPITIVN